ncbi:N-6 DNA methylase [Streptomyces paludis]|uniref:N-6 DNA methylase n=1 Tax=Streptomyces paludis TaxID=2282738 RepID=A0A345HX56_9ACTN|nr:N-6 DNA methylase [Streptomyces paludis]AXG81280.1 N-6 DNA methylase [Streptomyces paludis]
MTSARAVPVTLAEIARIAGVGRAAVSNWRRRHSSFPAPVGGTEASPQFALADVETWLRAQNKIKETGGREWLWPQFEALRGRDETGLAIAAAGHRMSRGAAGSGRPVPFNLSADAEKLVRKAVELGRREGAADTYAFLLRRWLDVNVRQISATPEPLAALMAGIAVRARGTAVTGRPTTVLDPACGAGHLLAAAAMSEGLGPATLSGCEKDSTLAALAAARLEVASTASGGPGHGDVRQGDSLRADPFASARADIVLCNPPFNERDWGYEELATDPRWTYGLPPRTEPELAWVQHIAARLAPGGTAVVLLPPAVASRKAGRRIRGGLLRNGLLRAVIALPAGCAQPHSVSLQLWVLRAPDVTGTAGSYPGTGNLLLIDAAGPERETLRDSGVDWPALTAYITDALDNGAKGAGGAVAVPAIELLDDQVDLTPARHVPRAPGQDAPGLRDSWIRFGELADGVRDIGRKLAGLTLVSDETGKQRTTTVGELIRAGALTLRTGQQPTVQPAPASDLFPGTGVPVLTVPDVLYDGRPGGWLPAEAADAPSAVLAEPGDVVVVGVSRGFSAWVHQGPPMLLGPQLHALRAAPERLDPWFLAGCLRAPSNGRQAGTHASSTSRVDVRKLQVLQMPLGEQQRHSEAFRHLADFESLLNRLDILGKEIVHDLSDGLVAGRLTGR